MSARVITTLVAALDQPSPAWRAAAAAAHPDAHPRLLADATCLHAIEAGGAPTRAAGSGLRVVAWNAERLKHVEASAALLAGLDADVLLLTEVDCGMARSHNRRTARDLAAALGMSWRYAVEFVELGLGDPLESAAHAGEANAVGLHGAAILSRVPLAGERLVRLGDDGYWFERAIKGQRRVGGRIALAADVAVGETAVRLVAVHLESHSDAAHRAAQALAIAEACAPAAALVLAGDFNTKLAGACADEVPVTVPGEPLFAALAGAGLSWQGGNAVGPTQRLHPHDERRPLIKLDWVLHRGLGAFDPKIVPALGDDGTVLSDHEILVCDIEVA